MRRAERLYRLVDELRSRRVTRADELAAALEISPRTVYRDIHDLMGSGVPIDGEAGVGYTLRRGFDLPPLMFTEPELEAMVLGARVVSSWGDQALGRAAQDALARVEALQATLTPDDAINSLEALLMPPAPAAAPAPARRPGK